jgi:hypothetical protein
MREPMVGDRVVNLAAHCDGVPVHEATVVSVQTWSGCAQICDDTGALSSVPLHELRPLDGSGNAGLTSPLDGYPRYT